MRLLYLFFVLTLSYSCKTEQKESKTEINPTTEIATKIVKDVELASGTLVRVENFPTQLIEPRNVDVWLPEDYSEDKKYAVLYMHDGQMLFDAKTTWNKQEWKVDEVASQLIKEGKIKDFIVVAIWNIAELRNSDYFPEKAYNKMTQKDKEALKATGKEKGWINTINSDNYLKFIVNELKPYIDKKYAVLSDVKNTFVLGSSRGGLISMYAISEYPEIFGAAACLSTHWIGTYTDVDNHIPDALFEYMKENLPDPKSRKLYFDYGTETLDAYYPQYSDEVNAIFEAKGFDETNFRNLKFEGAAHDEISWAKRLDIPLTFLLGNNE